MPGRHTKEHTLGYICRPPPDENPSHPRTPTGPESKAKPILRPTCGTALC